MGWRMWLRVWFMWSIGLKQPFSHAGYRMDDSGGWGSLRRVILILGDNVVSKHVNFRWIGSSDVILNDLWDFFWVLMLPLS